ncbi:MAG: tRNA-His guanylyltransferase [Pleopsidium flavum]|nr:MAG: tRNA-His guanylyltransferase [Pleopsidium flavum]
MPRLVNREDGEFQSFVSTDVDFTSQFSLVTHPGELKSKIPNHCLKIDYDAHNGVGIGRQSAKFGFEKPNDRRALNLMNAAAVSVMGELPDVAVAYGVSDEYSKIVTTIVSTFTAYYIHKWSSFFPDQPLSPPLPTFDGRAVQYPSVQNLRDYMSWRQVDCHVNNLYNTTFWAMVLKGGMSATEAEEELKGSYASDKNEILFSRFKSNYNKEPEIYRKGSIVFRDYGVTGTFAPASDDIDAGDADQRTIVEGKEKSKTQQVKGKKRRAKAPVVVEHVDIIRDEFWEQRPWLLSNHPGKLSDTPV